MFKVLKIIWNGDFLFLYITAFSRYNWRTINYTDLKCTGWILTYVYFQETDTIINVITSKLSSYPFIIHLHLYPYPQEATLLLTITVSMYGFSRILYGWNHSVYAISRDVGSDLFCVVLRINSLYFSIALYNSYRRNEMGSYITCHCLKSNTDFLDMLIQSTESQLQKSSKIDHFDMVWWSIVQLCQVTWRGPGRVHCGLIFLPLRVRKPDLISRLGKSL